MATGRPAEVLHGRCVEREVLDRLLEAVRGGESRVFAAHSPSLHVSLPTLQAAEVD
jgi:hypothetical protein